MSMWSPQSLPRPQSPWLRAVWDTAAAALPARAWPVPPLPQPGLWEPLQGLGKAKLPKLKLPPVPLGKAGSPHTSALRVPAGSAQTQSPRPPDTASGRALLVRPGRQPGVARLACQYLLPPHVLSSGVSLLACHFCPQAWCHHTRQALPGPRQDNRGTKRAQSELSPVPPPSLPGQARAGPHRNLSLLLLF